MGRTMATNVYLIVGLCLVVAFWPSLGWLSLVIASAFLILGLQGLLRRERRPTNDAESR
jgi:uncharacterized membrane protein